MKGLLWILTLVGIGLGVYLYLKPNQPPAAQPEAESAVATPAKPAVSATPAELGPRADTAAVQTPPPAVHRLAPAGTYFLLKRVSITTDSGILAEAVGTKVTLVSAGPPMKVTDGQNEFEVEASDVTNDIDVANQFATASQAAQAAAYALKKQEDNRLSQQQAALLQQEAQQSAEAAAARAQQEQQRAAAPQGGWSNPLEAAPKPVNTPSGYDKFGNPIWAGKVH